MSLRIAFAIAVTLVITALGAHDALAQNLFRSQEFIELKARTDRLVAQGAASGTSQVASFDPVVALSHALERDGEGWRVRRDQWTALSDAAVIARRDGAKIVLYDDLGDPFSNAYAGQNANTLRDMAARARAIVTFLQALGVPEGQLDAPFNAHVMGFNGG
jgi:hypothetical protein